MSYTAKKSHCTFIQSENKHPYRKSLSESCLVIKEQLSSRIFKWNASMEGYNFKKTVISS